MTFSENCVDSNYRRQGSLDRLSGTEKLKINRINIMKVYINSNTLGKSAFETIEVKQRFESDNNNAAPAHHILRKALRISEALRKAGFESKVMIVPQSAAELSRLTAKGKVLAEMVWHLNDIKPSKAKDVAVKRWSKATIHAA